MKKYKVLLLPSDHGGGRGHVARCEYLAQKLRAHGHQPVLVLEAKHYKASDASDGLERVLLDTRSERFEKYQFKKPFKPGVRLQEKLHKRPVFMAFDGLAYQIPRDGYWTSRLVRSRFKKLCAIVEKHKPQLLIGDTHFLTFLLGRKFDLPVVQITRSAGFPPNPRFLWWEANHPQLQKPDFLPPFESLLDELAVNSISKAEDLLQGDLYLIPASPEIEPCGNGSNVLYCGPFTALGRETVRVPFFEEESDVPKIYISIGGGADRGQEKQFFDKILDLFKDKDYRVLVSTGKRVRAAAYKNKAVNMEFRDWVPGAATIRRSDLVIFHGGYGTTMEVLAAARPSIVLPAHSEQEGNGRRLESLGVGQVFPPLQRPQILHFDWPWGTYSMGACSAADWDETRMLEALPELLFGQAFEKLKPLSEKLTQLQKDFNTNGLFVF